MQKSTKSLMKRMVSVIMVVAMAISMVGITSHYDNINVNAKSKSKATREVEFGQKVAKRAMYICENWKTKYGHKQSKGKPNKKGVYTFDCSGFVSYVHNSVMQKYMPEYELTTTLSKLYNCKRISGSGGIAGYKVKKIHKMKNLKPGDVVFFKPYYKKGQKHPYNHAAIYVGNDKIVHSTSYKANKVVTSKLSGYYAKKFYVGKRYVPADKKIKH